MDHPDHINPIIKSKRCVLFHMIKSRCSTSASMPSTAGTSYYEQDHFLLRNSVHHRTHASTPNTTRRSGQSVRRTHKTRIGTTTFLNTYYYCSNTSRAVGNLTVECGTTNPSLRYIIPGPDFPWEAA